MFKLELSREHLAAISAALDNAPFRIAAPVLAELQRQINEQQPKLNGNAPPIHTGTPAAS